MAGQGAGTGVRHRGKGHLAFGRGAHLCVGAALARLGTQIVVRMLWERTTWMVTTASGRWLPSIQVRRLERLDLDVR